MVCLALVLEVFCSIYLYYVFIDYEHCGLFHVERNQMQCFIIVKFCLAVNTLIVVFRLQAAFMFSCHTGHVFAATAEEIALRNFQCLNDLFTIIDG